MKVLKITLMLVVSLVLSFQTANATTLKTTGTTTTESVEKQNAFFKKEFKAEKRFSKWQKYMKNGIDFNDPVEKWLWFGVIGILGGIILTWIVSSAIGALVGAAGFICLVIWVVKKFAV